MIPEPAPAFSSEASRSGSKQVRMVLGHLPGEGHTANRLRLNLTSRSIFRRAYRGLGDIFAWRRDQTSLEAEYPAAYLQVAHSRRTKTRCASDAKSGHPSRFRVYWTALPQTLRTCSVDKILTFWHKYATLHWGKVEIREFTRVRGNHSLGVNLARSRVRRAPSGPNPSAYPVDL